MTFDDERNQNVWMYEPLAIVMINSNRTHEPESWEWNKWNEMKWMLLFCIQFNCVWQMRRKPKLRASILKNARKDLDDGAIGWDFINSEENSVENRKFGIEKLSKICISIQFNPKDHLFHGPKTSLTITCLKQSFSSSSNLLKFSFYFFFLLLRDIWGKFLGNCSDFLWCEGMFLVCIKVGRRTQTSIKSTY